MKAFIATADWAPKPGCKVTPKELEEKRAYSRSYDIWKNVQAKVRDIPVPTPKEDEILIKIGCCGVCGSDMHVLHTNEDGYTHYNMHTRFPVILGHEIAGEVVEIGSKVQKFQVGDLVAVEPLQGCLNCDTCLMGMPNQCPSREEFGLSKDGGMAEFVASKERHCHNINHFTHLFDNKLEVFETGALIEPTANAYNAMMISAGGFQAGSHVAVFGCGAIGLGAISIARAAGAARVFAFDTRDERVKLAKEMGADYAYNSLELVKQGTSPHEIVLEKSCGIGAKMIVEAAGSYRNTYPEITACMAVGAKVVQIAVDPSNPPMDFAPFIIKAASIHGSLGIAGHDIYPSVIRLIENGSLDLRKMISDRFPIEKSNEAIEVARHANGKVMIGQYY